MAGSTITSRRLKVNWIQNHWIQNQDAAITTADLRLGTRSVGSLAAGESNETNNARAGNTIMVQ